TDVEVPDEVLAGRVVLLGRLGTKHMREAHQSVALHVLGDGRVPGVQDVQPGEGAITGPGPLTAAVAVLEHGQQQSRLGGEVVQDPLLRHLDRAADRGQRGAAVAVLAERGGGGVQDAFTRCPTGRVAAARLWAAGSRSVPGGSHHAPPSSADGGSVVRRRKPTTHSVYGSECDSLPITRGSSTCPWVPVHRSRGER